MKSIKTALFAGIVAALLAGAGAHALGNAGGKSALDRASTSNAASRPDYFLLAQGQNSCLSTCQDQLKSCLAQIDAGCNSRGCNNERNSCNMQYNDCAKNCPAR